VPFPDHYFPLLYAMGAAQAGETPRHVFEGFQAGTLSMRCVQGVKRARHGRAVLLAPVSLCRAQTRCIRLA
jgi:hypothetical protein